MLQALALSWLKTAEPLLEKIMIEAALNMEFPERLVYVDY